MGYAEFFNELSSVYDRIFRDFLSPSQGIAPEDLKTIAEKGGIRRENETVPGYSSAVTKLKITKQRRKQQKKRA